MKLMTLSLLVFGVGVLLLLAMAYFIIRSETRPHKIKLPKQWRENDDK